MEKKFTQKPKVYRQDDYAFPVSINEEYLQAGITKRDYFAAKAMQAFITSFNIPDSFRENGKNEREILVNSSFAIADLMLKKATE